MKYFSTFTGIGGFEIGIEKAYLSHQRSAETGRPSESNENMPQMRQRETVSAVSRNDRRERTADEVGRGILLADKRREWPVCVGYSEINKYASSVYEHNFPGVKNYGDITKIDTDQLPDFDLLVGGFPCQAFSIAGKRAGFADTRGTLFFDLARILRAKQPRLFVFENVKGLLSHDGGQTFATIIEAIDELGYDCQWQVLNSKNHGVPQNRERVYIVGHLRGTRRPEVFPFTGSDRSDIREEGETSGEGQRIRGRYISATVDANYHKGPGSTRQMIEEPPYMIHNIYRGFGETKHREFRDVSPTIRTPQGGGHLPMLKTGNRVRRLTPVECERLQGFPDDWTAMSTNGPVSNTQRYKMCGNAVTTNVVSAVMEKIL